ncbi:MAG: Tat pathway signal sequence, partial [Gemmatimonadota bacterium]|nr:Tat pathway signal sequence [Gemmatimonadota bacterium]
MKRRSFIQTTAGMAVSAACAAPGEEKRGRTVIDQGYNLYWGDLHTHCNITYGHGSMEDALEAAVEQLDFCAIVAHALWPDIPRENKRIGPVVDYHLEAFARVRENWSEVEDLNLRYRKPGKFIAFLAYECHNMQDGDHNVYHLEPRAKITEAGSIPELKEKLKGRKALVIPHHMGYIRGCRGFNWDSFQESDQSPFVEIYSRHGCAETDIGPYPNLHDMGPRSHEGTAQVGLERGYKFGMIGSTDQHAGYPGSYGDGRVAVYAGELTAESLWEAFLARRVYASTGEKIIVDFRVNGAMMGREVEGGGTRNVYLKVEGGDFLDYVDIIKNGRRLLRLSAPFKPEAPQGKSVRAKVRFEWGWGRKDEFTEWQGALELSGVKLLSATPCFRGLQVTSPQKGLDEKTMVSRMLEVSETGCSFHS